MARPYPYVRAQGKQRCERAYEGFQAKTSRVVHALLNPYLDEKNMKLMCKKRRKLGFPNCDLSYHVSLATENKYGFVTIITSEPFQDCMCLTILARVYLTMISAEGQAWFRQATHRKTKLLA
jgi:hypothetical protein